MSVCKSSCIYIVATCEVNACRTVVLRGCGSCDTLFPISLQLPGPRKGRLRLPMMWVQNIIAIVIVSVQVGVGDVCMGIGIVWACIFV